MPDKEIGDLQAFTEKTQLRSIITKLWTERVHSSQDPKGLTGGKRPQLKTRDVPGKEREKTGMGKKLERNAFFPFPFLHFLTTFFFPFLAKIVKNG